MKPAMEPPGQRVTDRRRAVAAAGHVGDRSTARSALSDEAPSVRATALGALDRLASLTDADLRSALVDTAPLVRRRGFELAAGHPSVDISNGLDDVDSSVVEMAAWAMGERGDPSSVPALAALVSVESGHADPMCRESAVAALGAIGDPAGLHAVLGALGDKPAIRRRAAVALAAFVGPAVQDALRGCLEDRDWQVRQVAEDLLAVE
jgi:HEAT repeat protein